MFQEMILWLKNNAKLLRGIELSAESLRIIVKKKEKDEHI
jgi:hypothetical protein